ncbi:hypothetical protein GCM10010293_26510 [Streptomyces griseoflavus]|nr:hypothetical protein GCM10010293_26510 [Streptomyces griseoflavus]
MDPTGDGVYGTAWRVPFPEPARTRGGRPCPVRGDAAPVPARGGPWPAGGGPDVTARPAPVRDRSGAEAWATAGSRVLGAAGGDRPERGGDRPESGEALPAWDGPAAVEEAAERPEPGCDLRSRGGTGWPEAGERWLPARRASRAEPKWISHRYDRRRECLSSGRRL